MPACYAREQEALSGPGSPSSTKYRRAGRGLPRNASMRSSASAWSGLRSSDMNAGSSSLGSW